jgi:hypothetical protein
VFPQVPQLLGLVFRLVQAPLQQVSPAAHCNIERQRLASSTRGWHRTVFPQLPQLSGLLLRLLQTPLQQASPAAHCRT